MSLNSAPPPATPCSAGPDCQFFDVSRGTFRHLDVVVRTIRSVPTWDYDTYMTFFQEANFLRSEFKVQSIKFKFQPFISFFVAAASTVRTLCSSWGRVLTPPPRPVPS